MKKGVIRIVLLAVAIMIASYIMPGITLTNLWYAFLVALILSIANVTIKPILQILTLPITLLTLGFFLLVINALMVLLVDYLIKDFSIAGGLWSAMLFSIVISVVYWFLDLIFGDK